LIRSALAPELPLDATFWDLIELPPLTVLPPLKYEPAESRWFVAALAEFVVAVFFAEDIAPADTVAGVILADDARAVPAEVSSLTADALLYVPDPPNDLTDEAPNAEEKPSAHNAQTNRNFDIFMILFISSL
jgi:hypothetical protein